MITDIRLANTEVKEDIKTVCEWFNFKKSIAFKSFEISKSILLAERCFKQINNCDIDIIINKSDYGDITVEGEHLFAIVFMLINCFNNSYKYSGEDKSITVSISNLPNNGFTIYIKNSMSINSEKKLKEGALETISKILKTMNNNELLTREGGSGLYKSLHRLRMISDKYNLAPHVESDKFVVGVTYG